MLWYSKDVTYGSWSFQVLSNKKNCESIIFTENFDINIDKNKNCNLSYPHNELEKEDERPTAKIIRHECWILELGGYKLINSVDAQNVSIGLGDEPCWCTTHFVGA